MVWLVAHVRLAAMLALVCGATAAACCAVALGRGAAGSSSSLLAESSAAPSLKEDPLVVSGSPMEAEQLQAQAHAHWASPNAVAARGLSRTQFEGLDAVQAAREARAAFPGVVARPADAPPAVGVGVRIVGYTSPYAARLALPGGKHGLVVSATPIATETAPGRRVPIDLSLVRSAGSFHPAVSAAGVRIPARLGEGVSLPVLGVSLTAVDARGRASGASGALDGAAVFYADTATDTDTLARPTSTGFEENTILRGADSPSDLYFKVGLPQGAHLGLDRRTGWVSVVRGGRTIATILAPQAEDATGAPVKVSMSVAGDLLRLSVDDGLAYQYPIEVDPTVEDESMSLGYTWGFHTAWTAFTGSSYWEEPSTVFKDVVSSSVVAGQEAAFYYKTQGESRIYELSAETSSYSSMEKKPFKNLLGIINIHGEKATYEAKAEWKAEYNRTLTTICALQGCGVGTVTPSNDESEAWFTQIATESGVPFTSLMRKAKVYITQEKGPFARFIPNEKWVTSASEYSLEAGDPGLGVSKVLVTSSSDPAWEAGPGLGLSGFFGCSGAQCEACYGELTWAEENKCVWSDHALGVGGFEALPEGEDPVEATVEDPVGLTAKATTTFKIDNLPPHELTISGLPPGNEIGYAHYVLKASAKDGTTGRKSSGVASIALSIDGKEVGSPHGSCPEGPCTATAEWTINGEEYAVGSHTLTVTATSGTGELTSEEFPLVIHAAESRAAGPGSVELGSGDLALSATDVSVAAPGAGLTLTRTYNSRRPAAGAEGPLGPQWSGVSLAGTESLEKLPTGSVSLTAAGGGRTLFTKEGSKYVAPPGDSSLTLSEVSSSEFKLTDEAGDVTILTVPEGGSGTLLTPSSFEAAGGVHKVRYTYKVVEGIVEPVEALAPEQAGVTCGKEIKELKMGCRALEFAYAKETGSGIGEGSSEWKEYKGRLKEVLIVAYNPSTKAIEKKALAQYAYDKQGRLRAEWNPQVSPALKVTYGYDGEGHVTAVSEPGREPWYFIYGTLPSDTHSGRLMSVTRPSASTALLTSGLAPVNSEAPKLSSTSPVEGKEDTVSTGAWTNSPGAYAYQWEDCNSSGGECAAVPGAINSAYTPRYSDEEHTLRVKVTATGAGGSTVAYTAVSSVVPANEFPPTYSLTVGSSGTGSGQFKAPTFDTIQGRPSEEYLIVSDTGNNRVEKFSTSGEWKTTLGKEGTGNGEFKEPTGILALPEVASGYLWVDDSANNRIQFFNSEKIESSRATRHGAVGGMTLVGSSQNSYENVASRAGNEVEGFGTYMEDLFDEPVFGSSGSENGEFKEPWDVAWDPSLDWYLVADTGNNRIEAFNENLEYVSQFGSAGTGNGQFKEPKGVAVDAKGNVWVADTGNDRVQELNHTPSGWKYLTQFGKKGTGSKEFEAPIGIAVGGRESKAIYVVDSANNRVQKLIEGERPADGALPAGNRPNPGSSSVETIEYEVPLLGPSYNMSSNELEKLGQTDVPVSATAIFPPDEPTGWPAGSYGKAAIYFRDSKDRTVNTIAPGGAVSTSEYNASNDVVRTLSPDNRAVAFKETCESKTKCKSAEVAKLLDSESKYNGETKAEQETEEKEKDYFPGSELLEGLGPQHTVKLANGKEVRARAHAVYSYNEGAPKEGGPYHLVTKSTNGAQIEGESEQEIRTTRVGYPKAFAGFNFEEEWGWQLGKPARVTVEPSGLTHETVYEKSTDEPIETKMPKRFVGSPPPYLSSFGKEGTGNGEFKLPVDVAIDSSGNIWVGDSEQERVQEFNAKHEYVRQFGKKGTKEIEFEGLTGIATNSAGDVYVADSGNNRVQELSPEGKFIRMFGFGVSNGENKAQVCTSGCRAGLKGSEAGEFNDPVGVAVDPSGNVWVTDSGNNRVEEFNEKGEYVKKFGSKGTGESQFEKPVGIMIPKGNNSIEKERVMVVDSGNDRVEMFETGGSDAEKAHFGTKGSGNGEFNEPTWIGQTSATSTYGIFVADRLNDRVEEFDGYLLLGSFIRSFGSLGHGAGQFAAPAGVALDSSGDVYVADETDHRVEEWLANEGEALAHDTKMIYYTTAANSTYPTCGEHPEWAGLVCEVRPGAQPGSLAGLPELPIAIYSKYNIYEEPETIEQPSGSATRTSTIVYDAAGREIESSISSTVGTALPTVKTTYNSETGAIEKVSDTVKEKTQSISDVENRLGLVTSYTDASGNTSTFEYEGEGSYTGGTELERELDGRLRHMSDGKGSQTYVYEAITHALKEVSDSAAGKFSATYDVGGNVLTESFPNAMTAYYTYNQVGEATNLEYKKTAHCAGTCPEVWFSDSLVPSIHGQTLSQTSTLSSESYAYDGDGRLTQVQETPSGKGCVTRAYAYDEDTNRTSLTTYQPGSKNECTSTGGTVENHYYDSADRLLGPTYDAYGNITALPGEDAGGYELTSSFYENNRIASQTQNGQTIGFELDPNGRVEETVSTGKVTADVINHYAGASEEPAWTSEVSGKWTRNIPGIGGGLSAIQNNGETPVLQLSDLKGNIVATATDSETETKPLGSYRSTEYGVPSTEAPPKYSWLGAHEMPTELPSGVVAMGARSYVPQLGRFLQVDPRPGGSANAYTYTYGDPVDTTDLSGEHTIGAMSATGQALLKSTAAEAAAEQAAINAALRAEAERIQEEYEASIRAGMAYENTWSGAEGEEWEEEGEEEYAAYHKADLGHGEAHAEAPLLIQPLSEAAESIEGNAGEGEESQAGTELCKTGQTGPCARFVGKKKRRKKPKSNACPPEGNSYYNDTNNQCCTKEGHYSRPTAGGWTCTARLEGADPPAHENGCEVDPPETCNEPASTQRPDGGGQYNPGDPPVDPKY